MSEKFFTVRLVRMLLLKYSFDTLPEDKTLNFELGCVLGRLVDCMNFYCCIFCSRAKSFIEHYSRMAYDVNIYGSVSVVIHTGFLRIFSSMPKIDICSVQSHSTSQLHLAGNREGITRSLQLYTSTRCLMF